MIPGSGGFPWRRKWQPTPVFSPEKPHGQRSLVGYGPWALLYHTGSSAWCSVMTEKGWIERRGGRLERDRIYIQLRLICIVWQKPVQHGKAIFLQLCAQSLSCVSTHCDPMVRSLGWEGPLEEGIATHSSTFAWRSPGTEEPGGLQSMGSPRVRH